MKLDRINGQDYLRMLRGSVRALRERAEEINELNVFPIPDGDTGDNMLLTLRGGLLREAPEHLGDAAESVSAGMLPAARGNSGVILSQLYDGIAAGLRGHEIADGEVFCGALREGVRHAYAAVLEPVEGTMLTVAREAAEYAASAAPSGVDDALTAFLEEADRSLERTPELLPVLKQAGVVDSGGAGLIVIVRGMLDALRGEIPRDADPGKDEERSETLDYGAFGPDSELEYGYCTELLLRLQNVKTNIGDFDTDVIADALKEIGESIVVIKSGSIVKLHVHTKTPDRVLALCQRYGEFLKVKIENMSLQHNSIADLPEKAVLVPPEKKREFGVIAAAQGDGIVKLFREAGADYVVSGGQCDNPSVEAFLTACREVGAGTMFILPCSGNLLLAAEAAARQYGGDVRVLPAKTVGEGYAALSMFDPDCGQPDEIERSLIEAMEGVTTAAVSPVIRDAVMDGIVLETGGFVSIADGHALVFSDDAAAAAAQTADKLLADGREVLIVITGADAPEEEAERLENTVAASHHGTEICRIRGGQPVYRYLLIAE